MRCALLVCLLSLTFVPNARAAEQLNAASIAGQWVDSKSGLREEFTFYSGGKFAFTYQRKDLPVAKRQDGAYELTNDICSAGEAKGNLWIVTGSTRCCYKAYFMADTLILDATARTIGTIMGTCGNRTLKRSTAKKGETS